MNFVEELKWRGMIHDIMPGTEEQFQKEMSSAYVGIDPTADSLHIGHLVSIMMLKHMQLAGHKPIALIGGATGMIGDPSGKSVERNLLDEKTIRHNQSCLKKQLMKFLDFDSDNLPNYAEIVNNYDWMKEFSFLDYVRDIGKHLTINYMLAKDSVKKRLETGLSFTEFSYQLVQAYDFLYLYENKNCKLQMGGSDQWGNITAGTELIRRKIQGEAFALTCPLITKSDGSKFGKTEDGNIWLDPKLTSPYKFYQFWLNISDIDAEKYIKIFTLLTENEIEDLKKQHSEAPHLRQLQKTLAKKITCMVHCETDYDIAIDASQILFGKGTFDTLKKIDEKTLLAVFEGVPKFNISRNLIENNVNILDLLSFDTQVFKSKGEARRMIKGGGVSINKIKINDAELSMNSNYLIGDKYIVVQKGKKNYYLIILE
ncbi:MAG: tyrosine--tRNA ligase [Bacteroidetes bacterium]|jgi:tyrosyl-tRNA synthetase|nr:tyrosine--tRNA ligase [Bacteroidota bacterium]MBT6685652.1 tyrosine--tRNA ligase [Bacteroidota bacterium]MBT7141876.1 tyrosine--tRNA ligase [Bacteroidota bacterium]MBT7491047.1 tyrosine--tRNA ligase [Bacteroidota bacterium]